MAFGLPGPETKSPPEEDIGPGSFGLEQAIAGREITSGRGRCYLITRRLSLCTQVDAEVGHRLTRALAEAAPRIDALDEGLAPLVAAGADRVLFLDLETCGFAGTPLFLIGAMWAAGGDLLVEQMLARNYQEEPAVLARFAEVGRGRPLLATFNGKTFDWPFLRDRAAVWRIELPEPRHHCDLLHLARRRYCGILPDCKLQTLELYVCKRRRVDDIAGGDIPGAYHDFVRTGHAGAIRQIADHNFLDLLTMAELLVDLLPGRRRQRT